MFEIAQGDKHHHHHHYTIITTITTVASTTSPEQRGRTRTLGGVVLDAQGDLFGTTFYGGANNHGTVFEIAKGSTAITTVASFNGANGANRAVGVVVDGQGKPLRHHQDAWRGQQ